MTHNAKIKRPKQRLTKKGLRYLKKKPMSEVGEAAMSDGTRTNASWVRYDRSPSVGGIYIEDEGSSDAKQQVASYKLSTFPPNQEGRAPICYISSNQCIRGVP